MNAATAYELLRAADEAQTVSATGRPSDAYKLGQEAVDRHGEALRRLADA